MSFDVLLLKDKANERFCLEVRMEYVSNDDLEPEFNNLKNYFAHIMVEA
jgi:hypothetical protein